MAQVVGISAALHVAALVIFGSLTIYKFIQPPEPEFEPPPPLESIEPQKLEYKARSKDLQKNSSRPRQPRISVKSISQINTPQIDVALPEFTAEVSVGLGSAIGTGFGSGLGSGGIGFGQSAVNFLGVESKGERILIVLDVSGSVVNAMKRAGFSMTEIRDKTIEMINGLSGGTMFGIIQHSRTYDTFKPGMIPATPGNKEEAVQWMNERFQKAGRSWVRDDPDGIQAVLTKAFEMGPDVLFLLSDASYQRSVPNGQGEDVPWDDLARDVRRLQRELARPTEIHFVGFGVDPEDATAMKQFIRKNDGQYREFQRDS